MGIFTKAFKKEAIKQEAKSGITRDANNRIVGYYFNLKHPDGTHFVGKLSRDEMDTIYRLYTTEGANLTLRGVSRDLPRFTLGDLRRILIAFNITKASVPLSPHMREEMAFEDQQEYLLRLKEKTLLRKVEEKKILYAENRVKELVIENDKLKQDLNSGKSFLEGVDLTSLPAYSVSKDKCKDAKSLNIYLSDMHIGAYVNDEGVYDNNYSKTEVERRLSKIYNFIASQENIKDITIFNLGDSIDGEDGTTTRREHDRKLPQNMTNKEMVRTYIDVMTEFINAIQAITEAKITFVSVCESNHGGSLEYAATLCLMEILRSRGVDTYMSSRSIEHLEINGITYIFMHGKDDKNQNRPFPSTLNDATKAYFQDYILSYGITGPVIVLKGDSHVSSTIKTNHFEYKSVGSLFGASNWVHANFGNTPWGCDYSLFTSGYRMDGIISD